jgi:hypothetical protein
MLRGRNRPKEERMAVMLIGDVPGMDAETYDKVNDAMNFPSDLPDGLISHTAGPTDGGFIIVDIWESMDKFESFMENTLMPAMGKVGIEAPPNPQPPRQVEVHNRYPG